MAAFQYFHDSFHFFLITVFARQLNELYELYEPNKPWTTDHAPNKPNKPLPREVISVVVLPWGNELPTPD